MVMSGTVQAAERPLWFICLFSFWEEEFMKIVKSMILCPYSGLFYILANREPKALFVL